MHIDGRSVFGVNAEVYDAVRPDYPSEWLQEHIRISAAGHSALDIGCGTGKLSHALSSLGFDTLGVEPDARMAAVAAAKGMQVDVTSFERWNPGERSFDVVACGQAWHWLDAGSRARRAAQFLAPHGQLLLVWNMGALSPDASAALTRIYETFTDESPEIALEEQQQVDAAPDASSIDFDRFIAELRSEGFGGVFQETFPWQRKYTAREWRQMLSTESGHISLPHDRLNRLLDSVQECVAGLPGGGVRVDYECVLITAVGARF